jgi:hypothetical protein
VAEESCSGEDRRLIKEDVGVTGLVGASEAFASLKFSSSISWQMFVFVSPKKSIS